MTAPAARQDAPNARTPMLPDDPVDGSAVMALFRNIASGMTIETSDGPYIPATAASEKLPSSRRAHSSDTFTVYGSDK